jgi:hypothetical protein
MTSRSLVLFIVMIFAAVSVGGHDLFLKLDSYFLETNSRASVRLLNGTFQSSEGIVRRDRMRDVTVLTPAGRTSPLLAANSWADDDKMTTLELQTGGPGTYVVGISTKPREIDLKAAEFNDYLAHDGIPDILAVRRKNRELNRDVRERYSKHVRAVFQVGDARSEQFKTPLNYPVEIIPQRNPYLLKVNQILPVLCTLDGKPLPNQFVMAGWEGRDGKLKSISTRTDRNGIARFRLSSAGKWYVKMIHMTPIKEPGINYESKWATLTFEIR